MEIFNSGVIAMTGLLSFGATNPGSAIAGEWNNQDKPNIIMIFTDERIIDGNDIWPILSGDTDARSPYEAFYYYRDDRLVNYKL